MSFQLKKGPRGKYCPDESDRAAVYALASEGVTQEIIARKLCISRPALRKHFREELDRGESEATTAVVKRLHLLATKGESKAAVTACIFWLKAREGWSERQPESLSRAERELLGKLRDYGIGARDVSLVLDEMARRKAGAPKLSAEVKRLARGES